jgi:archaellum component FlaG (FlaF/FlaG flagellin family)
MARILLIASILLGFATAFLGYKTKQNADQLQEHLKNAKQSLGVATTKLKTAEKERDDVTKSLQETQATLKQKEEEATNAKAAADKAKADLVTAQSTLEEANKKVASAEEALLQLKKTIPEGVPLAELPQTLAKLQADKVNAERDRDEAKAVAEGLKVRADEMSAAAEQKERVIQEYKSNTVRQGLSGKIVAYNQGWNFVVLNIGDKAGLKSGVQMVVLRGGNMVGKIKVTSVEPSTAIADVLPGTIARGDSVQPGDTVVFEGNRR